MLHIGYFSFYPLYGNTNQSAQFGFRWIVLLCSPTIYHHETPLYGSGLKSSFVGSVRERRGRLAANNRRGLADELIILKSLYHE